MVNLPYKGEMLPIRRNVWFPHTDSQKNFIISVSIEEHISHILHIYKNLFVSVIANKRGIPQVYTQKTVRGSY